VQQLGAVVVQGLAQRGVEGVVEGAEVADLVGGAGER